MKDNRPPTLDEATEMRMKEFADLAESGITEMTGRLIYADEDRREVVGRHGGLKPSYPELMAFSAGPKALAQTIRKGEGVAYDRIYTAMRAQMEREGFEPARKRSPGRATVPPHAKLTKRCSHCEAPHTTGQHRFHGPGAFHKTHLWGFNPMTVADAARVLDTLAGQREPLTREQRALMGKVAQFLRAKRRTTAKQNPGGKDWKVYRRVKTGANTFEFWASASTYLKALKIARQVSRQTYNVAVVSPEGRTAWQDGRETTTASEFSGVRDRWTSNPRGECIGTLEELRYHRSIGKHPGFYKHVYKSRPKVWCLLDGSVWIEPKGDR